MKNQVRSKFETIWDEMMADLASLIAINSVRGETSPEFPFGEAPAQALAAALEIGQRMGFTVENVDNYAGTIDFGTGDEMIGVMAHLDIVPAGDGWTSDPFTLTLRDGRYYGRGVIDNKGPVIAALYGMRVLKELGVPLKKKIRLIVGTNEEQGSGCMQYYAEHRPIPALGFTPDGNYPLIFAEKGNFWTYLKFPPEKSPVLEMTGGNAFNAVPAECSVLLDSGLVNLNALKRSIDPVDTLGFEPQFTEENGNIRMKIKGRSAHGSTPEKGVNAVVSASKILSRFFGPDQTDQMVQFIAEKIGRETDGKSLGLAAADQESGSLTLNLGKVSLTSAERFLAVDIRFPVSLSLAEMTAAYQRMADREGLTFSIIGSAEPHHVAKDSFIVQQLLGVYREVTGDKDAEAQAIGGGTYARALGKNFVAFGPEFPDSEPMNVHDADEHIRKDLFLDHCVICTLAMAALAG